MRLSSLILGQPGPTTDTYVHDLDMQQIVIELWGVGNMTGDWKRTAYALATLLDLIKIASGNADGCRLVDDLTFLLDLCYARDGRTAWPVLRGDAVPLRGDHPALAGAAP